MKDYAEKYNLEFDGENLIAYRNHNEDGCGAWNKTIVYKTGKYYQDWRCDLDSEEDNSFGLGIWPKGNIKVSVNVKDWGVVVNSKNGKARVFGFTVLGNKRGWF